MPVDDQLSWTYNLRIPHDPRASRVVRDTLRSALIAGGLPQLVDVSTLLTSELVANAYRHAEGAAAVRIGWDAGLLRVSVLDANPEHPRRVETDSDSENGRGLLLLDSCADRWGVRSIGEEGSGWPGKSVWFEVSDSA
jgi:anti-sigma regulatory factor (Ser/Thr protein kinase)